jgi:D-beta-D-heptose 7-phosphate kinase/D-beta-D-heptose 1-phosphate adenosyltransferase
MEMRWESLCQSAHIAGKVQFFGQIIRDHHMLLTLKKLQKILVKHRKLSRTIVVTNGCFDVIHAGHIEVLRHACRQGDILIVAVNDDASVSRLKGPTRPVNSLTDRAEVLSAIRYVDHVVAFSEDTPTNLIEMIRPDVLVKGGDYRPEEIAGGQYSGRVEIAPLIPNHSTTAILAALS